MKYIINIQSISDIITNSSSETFCKITSDDKETLALIEDLLSPLFGGEFEYDIILEMQYKEDVDPKWCNNYDSLPEQWLEIEMPYRLSKQEAFYKAGLEAILEQSFPEQYHIIYEND